MVWHAKCGLLYKPVWLNLNVDMVDRFALVELFKKGSNFYSTN